MRRYNPVAWLRAHPFVADALLASALVVLGLVGLTTEVPEGVEPRQDDALLVLLVVGANLPIAWRRRHPQVVLGIVGISSVLIEVLHYYVAVGGLSVLVALYTVAAHVSERRETLATLALTALGITTVHVSHVSGFDPGGLISNYVIFVTAWILGDNLQTRRAHVRTLEERAALAEAGREEDARRAVNAERARIARELHDVVAHSVSVMVVQAGAARRTLDRDPVAAGTAMASIETTGRQSLNELRRLLGMLRQAEEPTDRVPQPSMVDVDALVDQTRKAGLPVLLEVEGEPRPLAAGIDLSAYRIVQEALTNTIKHAGPARATVRLCYGDEALELVVSDDGRGADSEDVGRRNGHGIVGMEERVSLFGGELQVGNRPGGGFVVRAVLPLEVPA